LDMRTPVDLIDHDVSDDNALVVDRDPTPSRGRVPRQVFDRCRRRVGDVVEPDLAKPVAGFALDVSQHRRVVRNRGSNRDGHAPILLARTTLRTSRRGRIVGSWSPAPARSPNDRKGGTMPGRLSTAIIAGVIAVAASGCGSSGNAGSPPRTVATTPATTVARTPLTTATSAVANQP